MPENKSGTSDIFEAMHTCRAMRRLKPDPVPDELIVKILRAGQAAASGGNTQRWKFLVLKDPAKKKAVQNMILACRSLGLGTTLTTRHTGYEKECDEAMGIPKGYKSYAILPIGYPMGNFGPLGRGPLSDVAYLDNWGTPFSAA